jgi:hypothetical protein
VRAGRSLLLGTALAAALLTGCGGSSSGPTATPPTQAATTTVPAPEEPHGRLTKDEYAALLELSRDAHGLDRVHDLPHVIRRLKALCAEVQRAPRTGLMAAQDRACRRVVRFIAAALAFETERSYCIKATRAGDASCFGELFSRLARASNSAAASAREVNAELRRRGLSGRCARGIGASTPGELDEIHALGRAARLASHAFYTHTSLEEIQTTAEQTASAADRVFGAPDEDDLAQLRSCPH